MNDYSDDYTHHERVPPHSASAEESLLGAMLLSRNAIDEASEHVAHQDFYTPANGHIYEAILDLYANGEPVDPVTVSEALRNHNLLDKTGGPHRLLELQTNTPATTNAAKYARIVADYAIQRNLITVGTEIAETGYKPTDDIQQHLDYAETLMFRLGEHRNTETTSKLTDLVDEAINIIEERQQQGDKITGSPTGFTDLDTLTAGLQPGTLNILGARPAMGKSSLAMGIAAHMTLRENRPVLFHSLEMSRTELAQRILCAETNVSAARVRNGTLTDDDWARVTKAIPAMSAAPLWIDDNPGTTIFDIRAKARRLQLQEGQLGAVIVDYLQLMSSHGRAENRQNEVAEISRGLKLLARELEAPVIALAQLNRSLEQRLDKRPVLSDLRESGCLTGDTKITKANGHTVTLKEIVDQDLRNIPILAFNDKMERVKANLTHGFSSGHKKVWRMTLESGLSIDATANHKFRTVDGWVRLDELGYTRIAVPKPWFRRPPSLALAKYVEGDVVWERIVSYEPLGVQEVFDATVDDVHNFIANNICAHNSVEADADIVMFLYRDEVYNPDTSDQGTAELLVSKHRAGGLGTIRLTFLPEYTRFVNMAKGY